MPFGGLIGQFQDMALVSSVKISRAMSKKRVILLALLAYAFLGMLIRWAVPPPPAVGMAGPQRAAVDVDFYEDRSWLDNQGNRQLSQAIFDEILSMIRQSSKLILVDMFLFNDWQGPTPETHRALASELTDALVVQKQQNPDLRVIVISDPINTVYSGTRSAHFDAMTDAGIEVVLTRLTELQDSNPTWSGIWRLLIRPLGNGPGDWLPNPFGEGRVSIRSYLALLNFKANHRKLLVTDSASGSLRALVSSANPHDGSSAHRNIALSFAGEAVMDLLRSESALLTMSGANEQAAALEKFIVDHASPPGAVPDGQKHNADASIQILSESRIRDALLTSIDAAQADDSVSMVMFYLSDRKIVSALKAAQRRGATVRVLLDNNKDAFGRSKNGVPNKPVAVELFAEGIDVRWCATQGEQCHAKWLHVSTAAGDSSSDVFYVGSANFTRRNLADLNLETDVRIESVPDHPIAVKMRGFFEDQWNNTDGFTYSHDYEKFAEDSLWLTMQYRFMESTGLSTF